MGTFRPVCNLHQNSAAMLRGLNRNISESWQHIIDILVINRNAFLANGLQRPNVMPPTRTNMVEAPIDPRHVVKGVVDNGLGSWCLTDCEISLCVWEKYRNRNIMKILRTYSTCVTKLMQELPIIWEIADKTPHSGTAGSKCKARAVEIVPEALFTNAVTVYDKVVAEREQRAIARARERAATKRKEQEAICRPLFNNDE